MRKNTSLFDRILKQSHPHLSARSAALGGLLALGLLLMLFTLSPAPSAAAETAVSWCASNPPQDVSAAECQALEELFISTGGNPGGVSGWATNTNWLDSDDVCTWHGVVCDTGGTQVESLDLSANTLIGTLPASLGNLTALDSLDLSINEITGPIPAELGNLTGLTYLDIGFNKLTGSIPETLSSLTNLIVFYLDGNQLEGPVPLTVCQLSAPSFSALYNKLEIDDACALLHTDWVATQTVPPLGVDVTSASLTTIPGTMDATAAVNITWTPVSYQKNGGGYEIFARNMKEGTAGVPLLMVQGKNNSSASVSVTGDPMDFAFYIKTHTDAHNQNPNALVSKESAEDQLGAVAVRMLDIEANTPLLYIPALAPLLLLLVTTLGVIILWWRKRPTNQRY